VQGAPRTAEWARQSLAGCAGYWVHLDVDVLDPAVMPAVDAPDPGGIAYPELELLLAGMTGDTQCLGLDLTVFDPDFDPDGRHAEAIVDILVSTLAGVDRGGGAGAAAAPLVTSPRRRSPHQGADLA
jgi:arginase